MTSKMTSTVTSRVASATSQAQSQPCDPMMSVKGLSWHLDDSTILNKISFSLKKGEMLGVIGPNGAGKSSLLRCLYRYIQPSAGEVLLQGRPLQEYGSREFAREVAVVLQDTPPHFAMTTGQLVAMGLTPHKGLLDFANKADIHRVNEAIAKVGLTHKANSLYDKLSGGEKQRALIARAIVQSPKLLILDEPTNHLDVRYQIQTLELVRSLGISVICSIHDLNLASALCDSLLMLNNGECVAYGSADKVLTQERISSVFGVCSQITPHPQHGRPLISYFYGYQDAEDSLHNSEGHNSESETGASEKDASEGGVSEVSHVS